MGLLMSGSDDALGQILHVVHERTRDREVKAEEVHRLATPLISGILNRYRPNLSLDDQDDVRAVAHLRLMNRIEDVGFASCDEDFHRRNRLVSFIRYSVLDAIEEVLGSSEVRIWRSHRSLHVDDFDVPIEQNVLNAMEQQERMIALEHCVRELTKLQRIVFRYCRLGLSQAEIARKLRKAPASIHQTLKRALENLRSCLRGLGLTDG